MGVLFTIPLRRAMVVNSDLPYPEGMAAAEILKVGSGEHRDSNKAGGLREILGGGIVAGIVALCTSGFKVLAGEIGFWFHVGRGMTQMPLGFSTALVGAGYLVGIASGIAMLVGILIAWLGFVPYFTITGTPADGQTMQQMASAAWSSKVRLIGAGAMGVAAVWTLITLAKPVIEGMKESLAAVSMPDDQKTRHRMDIDMSLRSVGLVFLATLIGLLGITYSFVSPEGLPMGQTLTFVIVSVIVAVLMGFFVAAACAYMAGLIGTSSSPILGIGILGIIISSLVVLALCNSFGIFDIKGGSKFATATAIYVTSIIMSIACISNDNMQDLKTGYLVGATPWRQQVALIIGVVIGAFVIAPVLNLLYKAYGFPGALPRAGMDPSQALADPQAVLMTTIATGIFTAKLAWEYIFIGIGLGVAIVIVDIILRRCTRAFCLPPLAVGMGIYLPPSVQTPLVVGAVMGYILEKKLKARAAKRSPENPNEDVADCKRRGTLFASGLIVGESIIGVILAGLIVVSVSSGGSESPLALVGKDFADMSEYLGLIVFLCVVTLFGKVVWGGKKA